MWFNSTKSSLKKLATSYNSVQRHPLGICKPYIASKMFVSRDIPTFAELLRTSIDRFAQRIEHSSNCIMNNNNNNNNNNISLLQTQGPYTYKKNVKHI